MGMHGMYEIVRPRHARVVREFGSHPEGCVEGGPSGGQVPVGLPSTCSCFPGQWLDLGIGPCHPCGDHVPEVF